MHSAFDKDKVCNSQVFQVDFAMAYSCEYQDEIKSSLLSSRRKVNLFTAAVYNKNGEETNQETLAKTFLPWPSPTFLPVPPYHHHQKTSLAFPHAQGGKQQLRRWDTKKDLAK